MDWKRVLVVDDDGPMLRTHGRVLETFGVRPVLMPDPGEALSEAMERMPALIVVDLVMPGMSGLEFVTRLRGHFGRACPPVLLVSANSSEMSAMERIMFDGILAKPYSVSRLGQEIRRLINEHWDRVHAASEAHLERGVLHTPGAEGNDGSSS
jgi:DNA-binding response OmpR family regulator